jgi:CRISPR/Cas system-associated endonuclease Cas1
MKIRILKNKDSDGFNELLNYGYAILDSKIVKFANDIGLDSHYRFYHKRHSGLQALAYD